MGCQMPALGALKPAMAKAKARPKKIAEGWPDFADRLTLAVAKRKREGELSQNAIAEAAGIESGQFTKILSGERALGLTVNTLLLLADALRVNPMWLMVGEEPSGLSKARPAPTSAPPSAAPPRVRVAK